MATPASVTKRVRKEKNERIPYDPVQWRATLVSAKKLLTVEGYNNGSVVELADYMCTETRKIPTDEERLRSLKSIGFTHLIVDVLLKEEVKLMRERIEWVKPGPVKIEDHHELYKEVMDLLLRRKAALNVAADFIVRLNRSRYEHYFMSSF